MSSLSSSAILSTLVAIAPPCSLGCLSGCSALPETLLPALRNVETVDLFAHPGVPHLHFHLPGWFGQVLTLPRPCVGATRGRARPENDGINIYDMER